MKPTDEQMRQVMYYYRLAMGRTETAQVMHAIVHWESIRPPCPDCANPPAVRDMVQKAQIRELWDNLEKAKAALPEWIPVGERLPTKEDGNENAEVLWCYDSGGILCTKWNYIFGIPPQYWIGLNEIAALPKRPTPVKVEPTAEEVERAEFEAWRKGISITALEGRIAWDAWKAARAGR